MTIGRATYDQMTGGRRLATASGGMVSRGGAFVIPVIAKTDINVGGAASTTTDILLAQGIDTSAWVSAVLVTRIHSKTAFTGTNFQIGVTNVSLVPEEPDVLFASTAFIGQSAVFTSSFTPPVLDVAAVTGPIGAMVRVLLRITQGTAGINQFSVSVDLIGRPA